MNILKIMTIALMGIWVQGCAAVAINTSTIAVKSAPRDELRPLAEAGDAQAKYELGKSYCCMGVGFSTQTATEWLCKAARQGHVDAQWELSRIYLGDVSRTPAPGQKLMKQFRAKKSQTHAYVWLNLAGASGHEKAAEKLVKLSDKMEQDKLAEAKAMAADWQNVNCEYELVYAD